MVPFLQGRYVLFCIICPESSLYILSMQLVVAEHIVSYVGIPLPPTITREERDPMKSPVDLPLDARSGLYGFEVISCRARPLTLVSLGLF